MTELLPDFPWPHCQAGQGCDRAPCFQARLEATTGRYRVHKRTDLCAEHLGAAIHAITAWARDQDLHGEITVLAIEVPEPGRAAPAWSRSVLAFATIPLSSPGGHARPDVSSPAGEPRPKASEPASAPGRESHPPSRSAAWRPALAPISLADCARGARTDWASGRRPGRQYRGTRSPAERKFVPVPGMPAAMITVACRR